MTRLSVIMPCLNARGTLRRAMAGALPGLVSAHLRHYDDAVTMRAVQGRTLPDPDTLTQCSAAASPCLEAWGSGGFWR